MKLKSVAAALALAASAFATSAQATDWGTHDVVEGSGGLLSPGWFEEIFSFSLAGTVDIEASAVSINTLPALGIKYGTVELFKGTYGDALDDESLGGFLFNATTASNIYTFADLGSGDYYYAVTGKATGSLGGAYVFTSTIPVPEPDTYAMLLAGIGMLGVMARRRMQ